MSPENSKVFLVENNDLAIKNYITSLERGGHTILQIASSLGDALKKIPDLDKLDINVAIVDGNLSEGDESGRDGETVAEQIKAQHPDILVIGRALENPISAADINCPKYEEDIIRLREIITEA